MWQTAHDSIGLLLHGSALPATGTDILPLLIGGAIVLVGGVVVVLASRRRRRL